MRSWAIRVAVAVALFVAMPIARSTVAAQEPWVLEWLQMYAGGRQAEVLPKLATVGSLKELQNDLDKILPKWSAAPGDPDEHRRAIVGFALDAAFARLDQGAQAGKLAEWACRQIRRHATPDDFDHRALMAIFALLGGRRRSRRARAARHAREVPVSERAAPRARAGHRGGDAGRPVP